MSICELSVDPLSRVFGFLHASADVVAVSLCCKLFSQTLNSRPHPIFQHFSRNWKGECKALADALRLPRYKHLLQVELKGDISDQVMDVCGRELPLLTRFSLEQCMTVSPTCLQHWRKHSTLRLLRLHSVNQIGNAALADIETMSQLEELYLGRLHHPSIDSWFSLISAMAHQLKALALRNIDLRDVISLSDSQNVERIEKFNALAITPILATMTQLEHLDLHTSSWLTSRGAELFLPQLTQLEYLNLSWSGVNDRAMQYLPMSLKRLSLNRCHVSDIALRHIGERLAGLQSLRINQTSEITDAGIRSLVAGCTLLTHVELQKARGLSTGCLESFASLGVLQHLDLWGLDVLPGGEAAAVVQFLKTCSPTLAKLRVPWQLRTSEIVIDKRVVE